MKRGMLPLAGAVLAMLAACEGDPRVRAAPPEFAAITQAAPVEIGPDEAAHRALAAFVIDHIAQMRKYPRDLRVAAVVGAGELDLASWPGTVIADELRSQGRRCGVPVRFVGVNDDFDLLVGFSRREKGGSLDEEERRRFSAAITRNRARAVRALEELLGAETEVSLDGDHARTKGKYPYDRWHWFLDYDLSQGIDLPLLPRMPLETWRENFDAVVAEIAPAAPDSELKRLRTEEFRTRYLEDVMTICPNNFFASLLNRAGLAAEPGLVTSILRDERVRVGMRREELWQASLSVLHDLRPQQQGENR